MNIPDGWHYVPHGSPEPVQVMAPLIGGYDLHDVKILGNTSEGQKPTIDGAGLAWDAAYFTKLLKAQRPHTIEFARVTGIVPSRYRYFGDRLQYGGRVVEGDVVDLSRGCRSTGRRIVGFTHPVIFWHGYSFLLRAFKCQRQCVRLAGVEPA